MPDYSKFILDFSEKEILQELQEILGYPVESPFKASKNTWGVITENPKEYCEKGEINVDSLNYLYSTGPLVEQYFITLSFTSLTSRPKDLFQIINNLTPGLSVLDFGSGSGTHSIACAQKGCDVYSVDISKKMLEYTKIRFAKRNLSGHFFHSLEQIKDVKFDFIICDDVIEHLPDPVKVLKDFVLLLKPQGSIHLEVSHLVNLKKGHLPQAIKAWENRGTAILKENFKKISSHAFRLISEE